MPADATPADPLAAWLASPDDACLLHAARHHPRWARRSILGRPHGAWVFTVDGQSTWLGPDRPAVRFTHDPFADLDALLADDPDATWIGYLSYDLGRHIESIPSIAADDRRWPLAVLHRCPDAAAFPIRADPSPVPSPADALRLGPVRSTFTPDGYQHAVARIVDRLHAGDAFEVNLATRLTADFLGRPRDLFLALLERSPAWFAAYLPLPDLGDRTTRAIASVSPELFLELTPDGTVTTRPIKGTRRASDIASSARHPHADLADSAKDRAELAMVVDMLRNDLGRVAAFGSVRVAEPRVIEHHPGIDHAVATVAAGLRPDATPGDLLRATLPGGSITGAPKVQAMQMIEQLEPVRRGPYCGAIGWLRGRSMTLSIAIRTACVTTDAPPSDTNALGTGRVDFHVGSGIVADSIPRAEWRETLHKAKPFRDAARTHRRR